MCRSLVVFLSLFSLSTLVSYVSAHVDGAGACFDNPMDLIDFLSNHEQPVCHPEQSQFGLYPSLLDPHMTMIAGCKYTVSLCGPKPFKGFLLYAQTGADPAGWSRSRIGSWSPRSDIPSRILSCSGNHQGTITHSTSSLKMNADFTFRAQDYINGTATNQIMTIQSRIVVTLTEWYTASINLKFLNIDNQNGALCPDPSSLPLTACPPWGIVDTSGCPAPDYVVDPHAGHNMDDMPGMDMGDMPGMDHSDHTVPGTPTTDPHDHSSHNHGGTTTNGTSSAGHVHDHSAMGGHGGHGGHGMSTIFTNDYMGIQLVFPGFTLNNDGAYVGALVCCFFMAMALELTQWMQHRYDVSLRQNEPSQRNSSSDLGKQLQTEKRISRGPQYTTTQQSIRSFLHLLRVFLSIFIMIVWMTLNVGLVLAALAGAGVGYYFFANQPLTQVPIRQSGCH